MEHFPENISFKYSWRKYQQRVLDDLDTHLDDNHLHVIAPPGSGKTVLGLEVALRLNKPCLILAPTIAIRNQWVQRFCELFLQIETVPDWISTHIKKPAFMTVVTYQALHAACIGLDTDETDEEDEEEHHSAKKAEKVKSNRIGQVVELLKSQGVGTIIVDEAHHMKNEWWKSLNAVKKALNPTIVGLTATPPYDVTYTEWQRYVELNGPVDAEISVPELVVENDLCPHQDYIFLSEPTDEEQKYLTEHHGKSLRIFRELKEDAELQSAMLNHPIFQFPDKHLEWIYNNLECYSALIIFLHANGMQISPGHLEIIGNRELKIPVLSFEWMERLLSFYLFSTDDYFLPYEEHRNAVIQKLKRNGIIERKTINFRENPRINKLLGTSLSKLRSIGQIVRLEYESLKSDLRMVILTDFIRKEFYTREAVNDQALNKIGVIPIFEQLRREKIPGLRLGILSGSFIVIPETATVALGDAAHRLQIHSVASEALSYDRNYRILQPNEANKHDMVRLVTEVFEQGDIDVLIGTKSLLGEGWDAPSINSLVLASFVGSYVLSNQMRGRAIRSERKNPEKTGNIWHLVCVDSGVQDGGEDLRLLKRRFKSFVGVSIKDDETIENGLNRIDLPALYSPEAIRKYNRLVSDLAVKRGQLKQKWADALKNGIQLTEVIKVPFPDEKTYQSEKALYYSKTIANILASFAMLLLSFAEWAFETLLRSARNIRSMKDFLTVVSIIGVVGLIVFGYRGLLAFRIYVKYRDISKDIQQIGEALMLSLIKAGTIQTDPSKLTVKSSVNEQGCIFCHLSGGSNFEKSIFIKSLYEIVSAIDNPRYLILRKSKYLKIISQKDYHAVPELIGGSKKTASFFAEQWANLVGSCELIFTRTIEGRKVLLYSRIHSLSSEFVERTERINKWR